MANITPIWFILQTQWNNIVTIDSIVTSDANPYNPPYKVSRQAGKSTVTVRFIPLIDIQQWQIEARGTAAAGTTVVANFDAVSIPTDGDNIIYIYVQDTAGTWY